MEATAYLIFDSLVHRKTRLHTAVGFLALLLETCFLKVDRVIHSSHKKVTELLPSFVSEPGATRFHKLAEAARLHQ